MPCLEKSRLIQEFSNCVDDYRLGVRQLSCNVTTITINQYLALHEAVETTRLSCEEARLAISRHVAVHGC